MKTPIADFVKKYCDSSTFRLHMPGHKAVGPLGVEKYDITEIDGADELYSASGIILESEQNAAALFGSGRTFYSTEGSSLCIKAMLGIATEGRNKHILAARNAHKAFLYGAALLDLKVDWLYSEGNEHMCSCTVTPKVLREKLACSEELPAAVYITSPDYLGNIQDIEGLSSVCREFSVPLLVDNAHGAYLKFSKTAVHPLEAGADMCCDSAHKTLPVLTGGAYLHISKNAPERFSLNAERYLSLFASTSPSYLILQSLDLCNAYMADGYGQKLSEASAKVEALKNSVKASGFKIVGNEPLKLTVLMPGNGRQIAERLRACRIEPEFCDRDTVVLMFTPETENGAYDGICRAFSDFEPKAYDEPLPKLTSTVVSKMSIREAVLSQQTEVPTELSVGRICAAPCIGCPPAVPIVMSGEVINEEAVACFKHYGYENVSVVAD